MTTKRDKNSRLRGGLETASWQMVML